MLRGPHAECARAGDEQDAEEHEARRVVGFSEDGRGNAGGGDANRGHAIPRPSRRQLEGNADRRQENAGENEVRKTPDHVLAELHRHHRQRQDERNANAAAYSQKTFSLAAWRGQTVRLQFRATTDGSLPTSFRVDDVSLT